MASYAHMEKGEGLIRSHELLDELNNDVRAAYEFLETDRDSQYLRRCLVRAVFSYIEALIECIKIELRSTIRLGRYKENLTKNDLKILRHVHVFPSKNGSFSSLEINMKQTFELAAKIWGLNFKLSTNVEGYEEFLRAKYARNSLTHPKTYYEIQITDDDMHNHTITYWWISSEFKSLFKEYVKNINSDYVS